MSIISVANQKSLQLLVFYRTYIILLGVFSDLGIYHVTSLTFCGDF